MTYFMDSDGSKVVTVSCVGCPFFLIIKVYITSGWVKGVGQSFTRTVEAFLVSMISSYELDFYIRLSYLKGIIYIELELVDGYAAFILKLTVPSQIFLNVRFASLSQYLKAISISFCRVFGFRLEFANSVTLYVNVRLCQRRPGEINIQNPISFSHVLTINV
jgi:hypothetical protein